MTRLLAIGGYVYQSGAAIVLIFAISHILIASNYTTFSLALASSQLLCVLMFEWLQLAGLRFLAAAKADEAARLRWSLFGAAILSAAVLIIVGGCASLLSNLTRGAVLLGLTIAVLQGMTDLYFLTIRLSDRLGMASFLLALRATALLMGAIAGALVNGTAEATLAGLASGHAVALLVAIIAHRTPLRPGSLHLMLADWLAFCRYGMLAAGASVIHLSVPVLLRFIIIGRLGATGAGAGFSIALDLLQRPFGVLNAAIHTVSYPDVVHDFENGSHARAVQSTRRMFEFMICTTTVLLGGLIAFLPEAAQLMVPRESLEGFMTVAPFVALFYFLQIHLQATVAVVPHLEKRATRLVIVAFLQLAAVAASSAIAMAAGLSPRAAIACAATATAFVILLALGPTIRFSAAPRMSLANEAILAALLIGSLVALPMQPIIWLAGKILLAAGLTGFIAWRGNFLAPNRPSDQVV
jgi:O-antigen/teichoic acid export membrane protein